MSFPSRPKLAAPGTIKLLPGGRGTAGRPFILDWRRRGPAGRKVAAWCWDPAVAERIVKLWNAALVILLLCTGGCAHTVVPRMVSDSVPSFDGTNQDSGFVAFAPDGAGIITPNALARYKGLIALYGGQFITPLEPNAGISAAPAPWLGCYRIDQQHLDYFATMNRWRKQATTGPPEVK